MTYKNKLFQTLIRVLVYANQETLQYFAPKSVRFCIRHTPFISLLILRSTHKPPVQSLLIIRLKTSTSENGNTPAMNTPCCHQGAHCECFRYWAASSVADETVRCGCCRTLFPDNQLCFLCLEKRTSTNSL